MKQPTPIQISIPQPCSEDWNKMSPQQQGRFCDSCQKCVVDFTGFTDAQLISFFSTNRNEHVCGRFNPWQLNRKVSLPTKPYNRLYRWFISLGFVIFLSDLFGTTVVAQERVTTELSPVKKKSKNSGRLLGTITGENNTPLQDALVVLYQNGMETNRTTTDTDGNYISKKNLAGKYDVHIVLKGYRKHVVTDVLIEPKHTTELKVVLYQQNNASDSVNTSEYTPPIVDRYGATTVTTGGINIEEMPVRSKTAVDSVLNKHQNNTPANRSNKEGEK